MEDARRVARNILMIMGGGTFRAVLMPLFTVLIARKLGTEGFGAYSFALSLAYILLIVGEMGLPKLVVRELAANRDQVARYVGDLTVLRLITGLASAGIIYAIIAFTSRSSDTRLPLFLIGLSYVVFTGLRRFFDAVFQAFEVMKYQAISDIVDILLTFGVGSVLLLRGYGLVGISYALMVGAVISMGVDFMILTRKMGQPVFTLDLAFWKKMVVGALPFGIIGLVTFVFGYTSTVLVSAFKGDYQAGLFSSAYRIIWAMAVVPATCMTAVFPFLARARNDPAQRHLEAVRRVVKYLACVSLPFCGLLVLFSSPIITTVYGESYLSARTALWILAAVPLFSFTYIPLIELMNAHYKQRFSVLAILACAGVNVVLCVALTPWLGFLGAALSTLLSESAMLGITVYFAWRHMSVHPSLLGNWKPALAALAAALPCLPLRSALPFSGLVSIYVASYLGALFALRTFDADDWRIFLSVLPRRASSRA
ncbi:flippase [Candidatus Solincola sp.]|nr:flippase [Actinomycetota bacterium]MDI7252788.1 flippase [Actinomycetota bacterium]